MNSLKEALIKEIPVFRELGHKFVNKEVSSGDFKAMSGGMGSYAQRGGQDFMIRLRIPSGIMSMDKFKKVYELAKKQNLDKVHLTTRQAIQLHSLSIDGVCDTMEEALKNDIFTRGGGGNFPRNVSISPLSGVDVEEAFDVTPYAEAVNEHFMSKITTYKLPRKLKAIKAYDFADCRKLTKLNIPVTVKVVYMSAFAGSGLKKIVLPSNVQKIRNGNDGQKVFEYIKGIGYPTKNLRVIEIHSKKVKSIQKNSFSGLSSKVVIKVPKSKKKKYTKMLRKSGLSKKVKICNL